MKRSRYLASLVASVIAGDLYGTARATPPTHLHIAMPPITAAAQPYFAQANGSFARAGLDVDITIMTSGAAAASAVISGSIDIGNSNAISLAGAHDRNIPFVYIAPDATFNSEHPVAALAVARQSLLTNAKDLNGKIIGVNGLKNLPQLSAMLWIDKNGGDSTTVKFVEIALPALPAALSAGRIDAGVLSEPFLSAALRSDARFFGNCYEAIAKAFAYGGFFTTAQWAQDHPDLVRAFRAAISEASRWANAHSSEADEILLRDAKLDVSQVKSRDVYGARLDSALLQPLIDVAARYGVIKNAFPASDMILRT
jgi:NitT/TauT family transport system substrate-binding protein